MAADKILTWRDFQDERVGALGSIWFNREPSYPDFLARMWETTHDGQWTPDTLPAKPATLSIPRSLRRLGPVAGQVRVRRPVRGRGGRGLPLPHL